MKQLCTLVLLLSCTGLAAQLNATLLGNLDYAADVNDVWGYVAPDGTEYAIVGLFDGVSIVSLADPTQPTEVARTQGQNSNWRDMKVYRDYAYVTSDQGDEGLTVIDLRALPDSISYTNRQYTVPGFERAFVRAHNIYIDTARGLAFTAGGDRNLNDGGILVFDVGADPLAPPLVGVGPGTYAHDVYVQNSLMYASEIYRGELAVYDVRRLDTMPEVGRTRTPFAFTHNAWTAADNAMVYTTDERSNASVAAFDITDFSDIQLLDEYRPLTSLNTRTIPHNVHYIDDYLSVSYYTDGLRVVDASDPTNLVEVANYDTWPGADGGFNGAWGAYPFLPSGLTLVSDRQTGLYVIDVNYVRAARLRGTVRDFVSGEGINGATIEILDAQANRTTADADGSYATGVAKAAEYRVLVNAPGYYPDMLRVRLINGRTVFLDASLTPEILDRLTVTLRDRDADTALVGATLQLVDADFVLTNRSDSAGQVRFDSLLNFNYATVATKWGYRLAAGAPTEALQLRDTTIYLVPGFEDTFVSDLGWTTGGDTATHRWQRVNVPEDSDDFGGSAYVVGFSDSTADTTMANQLMLSSPCMDLGGYADDVAVSYAYRYAGALGGSYTVSLVGRQDTVVLATYTDSVPDWRADTVALSGLLPSLDSVQLVVSVNGVALDDSSLVAGFDNFRVNGRLLSSSILSPQVLDRSVAVFPNPSTTAFTVQVPEDLTGPMVLSVVDMQGRVLEERVTRAGATLTVGGELRPGVYFLNLRGERRLLATQRLIKHWWGEGNVLAQDDK